MYTGDVGKRLASYRVDGDLLAAVTTEAAERGETVTDVVIRAFQAYIRNDGAPEMASAPPVAAPPVHTAPERYEDPPPAPACKHPVASVNEFSVCRDCGADVW